MEVKFYNDDISIDLTKQKVKFVESNSRFNDKTFTKFTFPYEVYMDENFINNIGDFVSKENNSVERIIKGNLTYEGKISESELSLIEIQGAKLIGQNDFGLEEIPNFDKKLSELPLESFKVSDIHVFAKTICEKKYPETNFNFPRLFTKKYSADTEIWDAFDGYYNDLKPDGSEMRRNYIDSNLDIYNVNIIHPCPHSIYLLKVGFADKGFQLAGDILNDKDLAQRWLFSGTTYFSTKSQTRYGFFFKSLDFDRLDLVNGPNDYAWYDKEITIEKPGTYSLRGAVTFFKARKMWAAYTIIMNNTMILWQRYERANNSTIVDTMNLDLSFIVTEPNTKINFRIYTQYHEDSWTHDMASLVIASDTLEDLDDISEDSNVVTNLNEVDLKRAVPDMTFGEYVNTIKNWFNYDMDVIGKTIFMNKLDKDPSNIKDFTKYEVNEPKRKLAAKRSFLLKFQDLDNDEKKPSMYYDSKGSILNGKEKPDTNIIEVNGYAIPIDLAKPNGYTTGIIKKDTENTVALVYYDGLTGGQNNAKNPAGCDFPELFEKNWLKWLRQRINGTPYEDEFYASIEEFSQFRIKDYIFWHNNIHQIVSWTKDMVTEDIYKISLQTETIL